MRRKDGDKFNDNGVTKVELRKRDKDWNEDGARKQLLQFFEAWGVMDPDTIRGRRKLSALLFS